MRNKILAAALCALPATAFAHVALTQPAAAPGAHYVAHFRVGHGCNGSPTIALTVAIPDGVSGVIPEPLPGWQIATVRVGPRISAVTWKSGSLPAATPGEFAMAMTLPAAKAVLAFAATQICAAGSENWSELPAPGIKSTHPAPLLYVGEEAPKADGMAPGMVMPDGTHMPGMHM